MEMPSAGRPLRWSLLLDLQKRGVQLATLTHAAGLSSTGDDDLDRALPLSEPYDIPAATVAAIDSARAIGKRVIAVGTTVVRALEACALANRGRLVAGPGEADLRIGTGFVPQIVDAMYTGIHEPDTSHFRLLQAFAPTTLLERAWSHAAHEGYSIHEFGDSSLILCG
jgi:S-adenosylmethionine:tRNA ribosyltransferase-isomerase